MVNLLCIHLPQSVAYSRVFDFSLTWHLALDFFLIPDGVGLVGGGHPVARFRIERKGQVGLFSVRYTGPWPSYPSSLSQPF